MLSCATSRKQLHKFLHIFSPAPTLAPAPALVPAPVPVPAPASFPAPAPTIDPLILAHVEGLGVIYYNPPPPQEKYIDI